MMNIRNPALAAGLILAAALQAPAATHTIKTADVAAPKELNESIRKLCSDKCVQLYSAKGDLLVELWFRKEVPVKATEAQIKNGLTYQEVPASTVMGAMRVAKRFSDYRKQTIKPGVYTLRMGKQPMDGDHMGTAPSEFFCLVCPAADDTRPDLMETKPLNELSGKATEGHPGVFVLLPAKGATSEAKLVPKDGEHQAVQIELPALAGDKKAMLQIALNLIGASAAA